MKSFHGGGTGTAVGENVHALRSAFGYEAFPREVPVEVGPAPAAKDLAGLREIVRRNELDMFDALEPVLALVDHALAHQVDRCHIEVVLRRHWQANGDPRTVGEPLVDATTLGSTMPILQAALYGNLVDATLSAKGTVIEIEDLHEEEAP